MIQDTTPYQAYQSGMGGNQPVGGMGAGINAASGAMAQTLADRATVNQGLNVTSQDTANQQALLALQQQALLTSPMAAQAAQKTQEAQQATAAGAQYGPEALASAAQATIAKNYTGKTQAEREQHESQMKDIVEAKNLVSDPKFDWNNKDHVNMAQSILNRSDLADVPKNLSQKDLPQLQALGSMAVQSLQLTQQMKLESQKGEQVFSMEKMKKEYDLQIADANRQAAFGQAMWAKPEDERAKARLEMDLQKQGGFTASQKSEAEGLIAKSLATDPETARIHETAVREWNSLRNFSVDKIKADADVKVPDNIKGQDQAASYVADAHEKMARDKLIDKRFNEKYPGQQTPINTQTDAPTRREAMAGATTPRAGQGTPTAPVTTSGAAMSGPDEATQKRLGIPANATKTVGPNGKPGWTW